MILELRYWIEKNRDLVWDVLRIYLGIALVLKGLAYLAAPKELYAVMAAQDVPFASTALAEYVAATHVAGGLALAFGLMTRVAALIQLPNVLGAIVFVHLKDGLFKPAQSLELDSLVAFLLVLFAAGGAGRLSVDWSFERHEVSKVEQAPREADAERDDDEHPVPT
jgi:putative oxidoreductase